MSSMATTSGGSGMSLAWPALCSASVAGALRALAAGSDSLPLASIARFDRRIAAPPWLAMTVKRDATRPYQRALLFVYASYRFTPAPAQCVLT
jgi:hypothetical protein